MSEIILTENEQTFKEIEKKVYEEVCKIGVTVLKAILEDYDDKILQERDKEKYRNKGQRKTTIKSLMGEVDFERRIYKTNDNKSVYLLDEKLDITIVGKVSENLAERIIESIEENSYRKAAKIVSKMSGQTISHEGARNVIQKIGEKIGEKEKQKVRLMKEEKIKLGTKETPMLFEEADGLFINLQGKDREKAIENMKKKAEKEGKEFKPPKKVKAEIKLHVSYEGWKEVSKNRYLVENKKYTVGFLKAKELKEIKETKIRENYDLEKVKHRVINGDGASWISNLKVKNQIYQLDEFHIKQAINRNIKEDEDKEKLKEMFNQKKYEEIDPYIQSLKYKYGGETKEVEKLRKLQSYLSNGLQRYKEQIALPEAPKGIKYRGMGVMESQIFTVLARRLKTGRMAFSKAGATNLTKVIALKKEKQGEEILDEITSPIKIDNSVEEYIKEIESKIEINMKQLLFGKQKQRSGIKIAPMPYVGQPMTEGRRVIRNLVSMKSLM